MFQNPQLEMKLVQRVQEFEETLLKRLRYETISWCLFVVDIFFVVSYRVENAFPKVIVWFWGTEQSAIAKAQFEVLFTNLMSSKGAK